MQNGFKWPNLKISKVPINHIKLGGIIPTFYSFSSIPKSGLIFHFSHFTEAMILREIWHLECIIFIEKTHNLSFYPPKSFLFSDEGGGIHELP